MHDGRTVGQGERWTRHERAEFRKLTKRLDIALELFSGCGLHLFGHRTSKKSLRIETPGHQFEVKFQKNNQFANFSGLKWICRHQRWLRKGRLDPIADDLRFTQSPLFSEQERDFTQWTIAANRCVTARPLQGLLKGNLLLEQL